MTGYFSPGEKNQHVILHINNKNLAVAFYDFQNDTVRHDWMQRVYRWMGIPDKVLKVLKVMMERWRRRFELNDGRNTIIVNGWINIKRGFLQVDSYSPVGFCLTEVPIAMILDETDGY